MGVYYLMMILSFSLVAAIALGGYAIIVVIDRPAARDASVGGLANKSRSDLGGRGLRDNIGAPGGANSG